MGYSTLVICYIFLLAINGIQGGFGPGEQDYGYVTVRPGAYMYWWLYHTTANVTDSADRPLIIWLMGGPGGSGTGVANFYAVGPLDVDLQPREHTWVKDFNILFVDNPVGVGYSFVEQLNQFAMNNTQIAKDLVVLTKEFFEKLPKFKSTPFYIYGISYGGKMGADYAKVLHEEIEAGRIECNLKGLSMGNPWIAPIDSSLQYGSLLYEVSLIDETGRDSINAVSNKISASFEQGLYNETTMAWFEVIELMENKTDGFNIYNYTAKFERLTKTKRRMNMFSKESEYDIVSLMNGPVKDALGIPIFVEWGMQVDNILWSLYDDFMIPVTETVEHLLNNTKIEIHISQGIFDVIVPTSSLLSWINKLNWKDKQIYVNAERETMWINNTLEGYVKKGGGMNFYWFKGAGHESISENIPATREFLRSVTGF